MQFSRAQRNLIIRAMDEAEERTGRYYCIPPYKWQQLRYDVLTCEDREWKPLPDAVLARIQCLEKRDQARGSSFDFYRIELNDLRILTVATQENLEANLYAFLVYILTHELVHLVRLSTILNSADDYVIPSELEESRVTRISRQILAGAGNMRHNSMADKFGPLFHQFGENRLISA